MGLKIPTYTDQVRKQDVTNAYASVYLYTGYGTAFGDDANGQIIVVVYPDKTKAYEIGRHSVQVPPNTPLGNDTATTPPTTVRAAAIAASYLAFMSVVAAAQEGDDNYEELLPFKTATNS